MIVPVSQTQKHNRYSIKELAAVRHSFIKSVIKKSLHYPPHPCLKLLCLLLPAVQKNAFLTQNLYQGSYHQAIMEKKNKKTPQFPWGFAIQINFYFKKTSYAGVTKIVALLKTYIVSVTKQQLNTGSTLPVYSCCINKILRVTILMLFNRILYLL